MSAGEIDPRPFNPAEPMLAFRGQRPRAAHEPRVVAVTDRLFRATFRFRSKERNMTKSQMRRAAIALLAVFVVASLSTVAFADDKVKVEGLIKGRIGPEMILQTADQPRLVVLLTDSTQVQQVQ